MKDELSAKVQSIYSALDQRFSESEVSGSEYFPLIFNLMRSKDLVSGEFRVDKEIFDFMSSVQRDLSLKTMNGLDTFYYFKDETPISAETEADNLNYRRFELQARTHLKEEFGNRDVSRPEFEKALRDYIDSQLVHRTESNRNYIFGALYLTVGMEFSQNWPPAIANSNSKTVANGH